MQQKIELLSDIQTSINQLENGAMAEDVKALLDEVNKGIENTKKTRTATADDLIRRPSAVK